LKKNQPFSERPARRPFDCSVLSGNIPVTELQRDPNSMHELEFSVRDYECDMQGVVNNAVYQNYLEHARHQLLLARGLDFAALTAAGINLVVVHAELDYRKSLTANDRFVVHSRVRQSSRLRFEFEQDILRQPDGTLMLSARITGTALNQRGRPHRPDFLARIFDGD